MCKGPEAGWRQSKGESVAGSAGQGSEGIPQDLRGLAGTVAFTWCYRSPGRGMGTGHSSWSTPSLFPPTLGLLSSYLPNGWTSLPPSKPAIPLKWENHRPSAG